MLVQLPNGDWVNPAYVSEVRMQGPIFIDGADPAGYENPDWSVQIRTFDPKRYHNLVVKGTEQDAMNFRDDWAETLNAAATGLSS